jgi:hypothetical protein
MENIPLLTETEAREVRDTLHRLREFWIHREPQLPFYTLGAASYLDLKDDPSGKIYQERSRVLNPILSKELGWMYSRLFEKLQSELNEEIHPTENFALPGFLIFLEHPQFQRSDLAFRHFDLPYDLIPWPDRNQLDISNPLSFTLAVTLPQNGGGIYTWDIPYSKERSQEESLALSEKMPRKLYRYQLGHMILHSGHFLHQIAPFLMLQPEDERITLQGHLIRYEGKWVYYL